MIKSIGNFFYETSQELRMLSRSPSDCKSLLLNVMKVSQKSHKRLSIVSQKSHKSLPKVSQKSLKSVSKVSQKSLKSLSKVSQKSLNWNQKSDRLTHLQGHLLSCPGQLKRLKYNFISSTLCIFQKDWFPISVFQGSEFWKRRRIFPEFQSLPSGLSSAAPLLRVFHCSMKTMTLQHTLFKWSLSSIRDPI